MNRVGAKRLVASLLMVIAPLALADKQLTPLWKTEGLAVPESVHYVKQKDAEYLLVSLIEGGATDADGQGGIAKLDLAGKPLDKNWIAGLNAPKGMGIYKNKLYVSDINEVVVIDIKRQKIIKKIPVPGSQFLNDVTVNNSGQVFVSDTQLNRVYRIVGAKAELYLDQITAANGLKVFGKNLIVGAGKELLLVDAKKNQLTLAKGFAQGIDGIEMIAPNEFLISCWPGLIYYVDAKGKLQLLLDSQAEKINTADIGYDPERQQVFVPNFLNNSVTAYQLESR